MQIMSMYSSLPSRNLNQSNRISKKILKVKVKRLRDIRGLIMMTADQTTLEKMRKKTNKIQTKLKLKKRSKIIQSIRSMAFRK